MKNKKVLWLAIFFLMALPIALAQMEHEEGLGNQFNELQPFEHLSEGHWFAFVLSLLLWVSLIYTTYSIVQRLRKKRA